MDGMLKDRKVHIIPYAHADYAWTHYRQWHIERYILIINEVLDIMRDVPEFTYMTDNYQHFLEPFVLNCRSRLDELRQRVKEGRFEITNCVISLIRPTQVGEETFVRNIVLGRRKFQSLFPGIDTEVYHNVDVSAGHSQMPQLLKLGGYKYFRCWRPQGAMDYKKVPGQLLWKGLDGTGVICSRGGYTGMCGLDYLEGDFKEQWEDTAGKFYGRELENAAKRSEVADLWLSHGMDDSRPLKDYDDNSVNILEFIKEWNLRETCILEFSTAAGYFDAVSQFSLPVVEGILDACDVGYNTPTKGEKGLWRLRQTVENALVKAETLCSFASMTGKIYPQQKLEELWTDYLGICGHGMDITLMPDYEKLYANGLAVKHCAEALIEASRHYLAENIEGAGPKQYIIFNTLNWEREEIINLHIAQATGGKDFELTDADGNRLLYQVCGVHKGDVPYKGAKFDEIDVAVKVRVPPLGHSSIFVADAEAGKGAERFGVDDEDMDFRINGASGQTVDTGEIKAVFSEGRIIRVTDEDGSILFTEGDGGPINDIRFTRVRRHTRSAWLFFNHYTGVDRFAADRWHWEEFGPLRWKYAVEGRLGTGRARLQIILYKGRRQIDFDLEIICTESAAGFYSAGFPAADEPGIIADIPFGAEDRDIGNEAYGKVTDTAIDNIERLWKGIFYARSWVNYHSPAARNSIISANCSPYFMFDGQEKRISIILTRVFNLEECEDWVGYTHQWNDCIGRHHFGYSLYLHKQDDSGLYPIAKLAREKMHNMEIETKISKTGKAILPAHGSMVGVESGSAVMTSLYVEEGKFILRFYESKGIEDNLKIKLRAKLKSAHIVDFLGGLQEQDGLRLVKRDDCLEIRLKPWEVITIALSF